MARIYWDEFFEASVTLANSQREKLIPVERYDLMYYFYFGLTISLPIVVTEYGVTLVKVIGYYHFSFA